MIAALVVTTWVSLSAALPTHAEMERDLRRSSGAVNNACGGGAPGTVVSASVGTDAQAEGEHLGGTAVLVLEVPAASGGAPTQCQDTFRFEYILTQHGWEFDGLRGRVAAPMVVTPAAPAQPPPSSSAEPAARAPRPSVEEEERPARRRKPAPARETDGDDDDDDEHGGGNRFGAGVTAACIHTACGALPGLLTLIALAVSPFGCLGLGAVCASFPIGASAAGLDQDLSFVGLIVLGSGLLLCVPTGVVATVGALGTLGAAAVAALINRAATSGLGRDVSLGRLVLLEVLPPAAALGASALVALVGTVGFMVAGGMVGVIVGSAIGIGGDNTGPILGTSIPLGVALMIGGGAFTLFPTLLMLAGGLGGAVGALLAAVLD